MPTAPSTVRQPAGSYLDEKAFGNPELWLEDRARRARRGRFDIGAALRFGLGLPLADHGESLIQNRALAISDAP